jgi:hypothetical protein
VRPLGGLHPALRKKMDEGKRKRAENCVVSLQESHKLNKIKFCASRFVCHVHRAADVCVCVVCVCVCRCVM